LIDVHFHCLPGIDDGPPDWEEAVALCRAAAAAGADAIVATPHVHRTPWANGDRSLREALRGELNRRLGGTPRVLPGCEYLYADEAFDLWDRGARGPLIGINGTAALLVEFAPDIPWRSMEAAVHEFTIAGVTIVVAHPERHRLLARSLGAAASLVDRGARFQITAGSLLGDFGERRRSACEEMLGHGLVHLVASDAHSLEGRPPRLLPARERVARSFGREMADGIFERNPSALVAGIPLPWVPAVAFA
jgi:protein-tyrosine phosphatase